MASSRGTSNGPDVRDITATMIAFEAINKVRLQVLMGVTQDKHRTVLACEAVAWPVEPESGEVQPLASAKCLIGLSDRRTVDAVILQLMYKLDAELAEEEFRRAGVKRA